MSRERKTGGLGVAATIPPGVPNATSFGPGPSIVQVCPSCACRVPRNPLSHKCFCIKENMINGGYDF